MTDTEKLVHRWLDRVQGGLGAAQLDRSACEKDFAVLRGHVERLLEDQFPQVALPEQLWADALLSQAREDLAAVELLAGLQAPASVMAMLLQMVFEKIAKAALARTDVQAFRAYRTSHVAASRLVKTIKNHGKYTALRYNWSDVLPMVQALERAHPAVAKGGPHLEYPWEASGEMALPSALSVVKQLNDPRDPKAPRLIRFARELSDRFDELFT